MGRIVSPVFRARGASTAVAMYHAACEMLEGCCPRAARVLEEAEPDALAYLDFPTSRQQRAGARNRKMKYRSRVVQVFPPGSSLLGLVGSVMRGQAETWSGLRYSSERKMA